MSNSIANEPVEASSSSKYLPWLVCLSAGLFFFYEFFQLNLFDVINKDLRISFAIDAARLSWMSSACVWANVVFLLPAGVMLDHFAVKKIILWSLLICVLSTFGFATTTSFNLATFYHSLVGIGNAFCFLACVVLVTRWFPPKKQALVIGLIVTMAFLGGMAAHTPFAYLNYKFGWRNAVLIDGLVGVFIQIWIYFFVHDKSIPATTTQTNNNRPLSKPAAESKLQGDSERRTGVDTQVHEDLSTESTKQVASAAGFGKRSNNWFHKFTRSILNKQTWLAGLYTSCLNLPIMILCALWGGSYLIDVHQLNSISASNIVSLILFGSIIGCPFLGWISDKQGKRKPTMLWGAIFTLLLVLPLMLPIKISIINLSLIFLGLGFVTSAQVISYPLIAESNHPRNTGVATGIASIIIMSGGGLGQLIFGNLITVNYFNNQVISDYKKAMLIFPISACIALAAILLIKETYCSPQKLNN